MRIFIQAALANLCHWNIPMGRWGIISYPVFASTNTEIYPHATSQYYARSKAKRGVAMLSVDKFPYPRKQTRGNEFITCSNDVCHILKQLPQLKRLSRPIIVTRSQRQEKGTAVVIAIVTSSVMYFFLYLTLMTSNVRYVYIHHGC